MIAPLRLQPGEDLSSALFLRLFDKAPEAWRACAKDAVAKKLSRPVQDLLVALWRRGAEVPVLEHPIGLEFPERNGKPRQHRFDLAWPRKRIALEYDGSVFGRQGRHSRGAGIRGDAEKVSLAAGIGWRVLRCVSGQTKQAAEWVAAALAFKEPAHENGGVL